MDNEEETTYQQRCLDWAAETQARARAIQEIFDAHEYGEELNLDTYELRELSLALNWAAGNGIDLVNLRHLQAQVAEWNFAPSPTDYSGE